jgi:hypothetical protein
MPPEWGGIFLCILAARAACKTKLEHQRREAARLRDCYETRAVPNGTRTLFHSYTRHSRAGLCTVAPAALNARL